VFLAESILHTLDPFVLRISGEFGIRWYGTAYAIGFLIAWLILRWLAGTGRVALSRSQAGDLITMLAVGVLAGGRLGHILFYEPSLLTRFSGSFPFWGALDLQHGGMSSHGGMIGVGLAAWWAARHLRMPVLAVADLACFAAPAGLGLGRLANWVNGELPGKALPAADQASPPWWSVKYPSELLDPSFSRAAELSGLEPLRIKLGLPTNRPLAEALYEACYRHNAEVIAKVSPLLTAHYPNNFMQAITDGLLLPLVLVVVWRRPRPLGTITGAFLITYGALRLLTEQYRVPDPDILPATGFTLPMLLSGLMCAAGLALILVVRRSQRRHGGLIASLAIS
jgi:phosphatidylglycerol:prolipoprotein diacylglycerol transferase